MNMCVWGYVCMCGRVCVFESEGVNQSQQLLTWEGWRRRDPFSEGSFRPTLRSFKRRQVPASGVLTPVGQDAVREHHRGP